MQPKFSVVVPALREAPTINLALAHVNALAGRYGGQVEVLVVDGDPEMSTCGAVNIAALERLDVHLLSAPKGRARQMNTGAAAATGEYLLFLHADTLLPGVAGGAFALAERALKLVPAGAFDLGIDSRDFYIRLVGLVGRNRTRLTRVPYGDQAIFIRRTYFMELGGFAEMGIMEDVDLMRRIGGRGDALAVLRPRVTTSARRWREEGPLYTTLRNWLLVSRFLLGADPDKLAAHYRPHGAGKTKQP